MIPGYYVNVEVRACRGSDIKFNDDCTNAPGALRTTYHPFLLKICLPFLAVKVVGLLLWVPGRQRFGAAPRLLCNCKNGYILRIPNELLRRLQSDLGVKTIIKNFQYVCLLTRSPHSVNVLIKSELIAIISIWLDLWPRSHCEFVIKCYWWSGPAQWVWPLSVHISNKSPCQLTWAM